MPPAQIQGLPGAPPQTCGCIPTFVLAMQNPNNYSLLYLILIFYHIIFHETKIIKISQQNQSIITSGYTMFSVTGCAKLLSHITLMLCTEASCQGFTKSHSSPDLNGLQLKGLIEYPGSCLILDYLRPNLESKWLIMQTIGYHLRLSWTQTFEGDLRKECLRLPPGILDFYITFLFHFHASSSAIH
jgi:hypothetical protein